MSKEILRPSCLKPIPNTFCPGCLHSMANKLVGQCRQPGQKVLGIGLRHEGLRISLLICSDLLSAP